MQSAAVNFSSSDNLTTLGVPFILLAMVHGRLGFGLCFPATNFAPPQTFNGVRTLTALETVLERESAYIELVQEEANGENVLAVFECSVRDLLFPTPVERLSYSGMDLDLLMEPTRDFPVGLAPHSYVFIFTAI